MNWMSILVRESFLPEEERLRLYQERLVGRVGPEDNDGIGVSTVNTPDFGFETALLNDNAYPVERYKTREQAINGHKKWVKKSKKLIGEEITVLGDGWLVEDYTITLIRKSI